VRCIKPNLEQRADLFVRPLVLNQLRCGGVMEAVRISSAGYPSRTSYAKIYDRCVAATSYRGSLQSRRLTHTPRTQVQELGQAHAGAG